MRDHRILKRLTYANVMSTIGVFIALGGTSYAVTKLAKNSVGEAQIQTGAVTTDKIRDGAVSAADLAPGAAQAGPRGPRGAEGAPGPAGAGIGAAEAWKPIPFGPGWSNYGTPWQIGEYRKNQLGEVEVRGLVSRVTGSPADQTNIGQLPVGYRPSSSHLFRTNAGPPDQLGRVDVYGDGTIRWVTGSTTEPDYMSLDGIVFDTN